MSVRVSCLMLAIWCAAAPLSSAPITLELCLQQAAEANRSLKAAAHDQDAAATQVRQARSGHLPRVDLSLGYTFLHEPQAFVMGGTTIENQERDFPTAGISLTQTISDFGRSAARIARAEAQQRSATASYVAGTTDLNLQVIEAYFGILEAEKLVRTADEEVTQMEDHLRVATSLLEQGVVTRNDQLQASVRLAASRQQRLAMGNMLDNRWAALNHLLGRPLQIRDELTEPPLAPFSETVAEDIRMRPERLARAESVSAAASALREARANYRPEMFARLAADYMENLHVREQTLYTATIGLRINLFDGFATTAERQRAVIRLRQEEDRLSDLDARIELERIQSANDVRVARERISVTEQAIAQSEENLRINRDRYQEQVGTATEVLDAQTLLTQSRTDHFRAIYDYQVAVARLKRANGTL